MQWRWVVMGALCCAMAGLARGQSGPVTGAAPAAAAGSATAASLRPVPPEVQQATAQETLRQMYAAEFGKAAPADRQALARQLLAWGKGVKDDAVGRYVALHDAADLGAGAGDAETAAAAIDVLAASYNVDRIALRRAALEKASAAATGEADFQGVVRLALETAGFAAEGDDFETVSALTDLALETATHSHRAGLVASIQVPVTDLRGLALAYLDVKAAQAKLQQTPDDAEAHLVVGRYYALQKGQWSLGLPHLLKGSDVRLAAIASQELANLNDGVEQTALADQWWTCAQRETGMPHRHAQERAVYWYKSAQESLQKVTMTRIAARLEQAAAETAPKAPTASVALLPLVDAAHDGAVGKWTRGPAGITCAAEAYACLQIPYVPAEEYDFTTTFTRTKGEGAIAVLLAAQKRSFGFVLDIKNEARFEQVNGKLLKDNPTVVPVAISNGKQYTLTIEVRSDHVRAALDGKELCNYKTDLKDLTRNGSWKLGDNLVCGIGANNAEVTFHAIEMVEVKGKGKATR